MAWTKANGLRTCPALRGAGCHRRPRLPGMDRTPSPNQYGSSARGYPDGVNSARTAPGFWFWFWFWLTSRSLPLPGRNQSNVGDISAAADQIIHFFDRFSIHDIFPAREDVVLLADTGGRCPCTDLAIYANRAVRRIVTSMRVREMRKLVQ